MFGIICAALLLLFIICKIWKIVKFKIEKKVRFEKEYDKLIGDAFQYDEERYTYFMKGIDNLISNNLKKAMPVFEELQREAETVTEQYAVGFFIAECYFAGEEYQKGIAVCSDLIKIDAQRINA